jgi:hypothetical protein
MANYGNSFFAVVYHAPIDRRLQSQHIGQVFGVSAFMLGINGVQLLQLRRQLSLRRFPGNPLWADFVVYVLELSAEVVGLGRGHGCQRGDQQQG